MEVHQTNNNNNPIKNFSQLENTQNSNENQINKSKKTHMNETLQKIKDFLEKNDTISLNSYIQNQKIEKKNLNDSLCLSLQKYTPENKKILEFIDILLKNGAEPDCHFHYIIKTKNLYPKIEDKDNVNGLMYACLKGDINLIKTMLQYKLDINKKDKNGRNALFYAILSDKGENLDIIKLLVNNGINVNCVGIVETGRNTQASHSPLSLAAINNLKNTFLFLVEKGADINFKSSPDKESILHIAVKNENLDIIKILLSCDNIKIDEPNKEGIKAFEIAMNRGHNIICNMIIEKLGEDCKNKNENFNNDNFNDNNNILLNNFHNNNFIENNNFENRKILDGENMRFNINNNNYYNNAFPKKSKLNYNIHQKLIFSKLIKGYGLRNKSSIQIPIFFDNKSPFKNTENNKLDTYINIDPLKQPTLTIDLSQEKLDYELEINKLTNELKESTNIIKKYEIENNNLKNDFEKMNINSMKLTEKIIEQERIFQEKENQYQQNISNLLEQIEILQKENENLANKVNTSQKEFKELYEKYSILEQNNKNNTNITTPNNPSQYSQFLNKKFIHFTYDQQYVFSCLSKDISDYQIFVKELIEREQNLYDTIIKNIQISIDEIINDYEVHLYGSHATNLCLPWSDIDVVLINKKNPNSNNVQVLLSQIYEHLMQKNWVKEIKFLSGASTPIVKLISSDNYNNMHIDISIQDDKHFGLKCVDLVNNFISQYESLKPLVLVLKNILKIANLNDPYKGGISSYGLILMIVSFLQAQKRVGNDISINENNLGKLFFDFVNHYGLKFDPRKYIIIAKKNEYDENEINFQNIQIGSGLVIIDPLNTINNVAKSCFQFFNIKMSFIICIITLKEDCECGCHYTGSGEAYNNLNTDHCFLKRIFNSVKRFQLIG